MGRKVGLTRAQVVAAAADVADKQGLAAVSLATVAATLGVRTPSLYAHVDGLTGLRRDLAHRARERLAAHLAAAAAGEPSPVASLHAIARAYREFARAHPGLYAALLPVPTTETDPAWTARAAEPVQVLVTVLAELGITPSRHIHLIHTLRAVLHGFVDLELGHGFGPADRVDASFEAALSLVIRAMASEAAGGMGDSLA
ncbi:TetR/AcrR family transcriptional regulator [Krasilnikovia sp. MM14-A1004]|uniref:TetR/AcrR family transcriptional regulator n=1 Tax=Krasilnikovia sp. MM14-A1004 TaxID=3373541 RepID=UPI00399D31BC